MTDKIKDKIAALLAKAEGTDNEFEQETFMAKVNELLEKHQIEMHEIRTRMGRDNDPMGTVNGEMTRSHEWPSYVGNQLATLYGCKMVRGRIRGTNARYSWVVVGRESATTTFDMMFPFVQSQVRQQARKFAKEMGVTSAKAERAVGMALSSRIYKMTLVAKERRAELESKALVPVDDVEAYFNELYSPESLKKAKSSKHGYDGRAKDYAEKVSLNVQATSANVKKIA